MINLLKILWDFFFVITSHNIFDAWPKTTFLLPVWHRDAKRLGIPAKWNPPMCIWVSDYLISLFLIPSMFWKFFFLTWRYVTPFNVDSPQRMKLTNSNLCLCLRHRFLSFYIVQLQLLKCSSIALSCPSHPQTAPTVNPTHCLCPWVLYTVSLTWLFPFFPLLFPSPSLLVIVSLFCISMSPVLFFLFLCFVDQVPLRGEIIWHLSFTTWLISLSIMLSSSIHAVVKGRSSFFPFAA